MADEDAHGLAVTVMPEHPFIERRGGEQRLNFDVIVDNEGGPPLRLVAIRLIVFDDADRVVLVHEISENGHPPAIELVGHRSLPQNGTLDLFNPFFAFDGDVPLHRLRYELSFVAGDRRPGIALAFDADLKRSIDVYPIEYPGKGHQFLARATPCDRATARASSC